jgi:hypothetical protein
VNADHDDEIRHRLPNDPWGAHEPPRDHEHRTWNLIVGAERLSVLANSA